MPKDAPQLLIRVATKADRPAILKLVEDGTTYVFAPASSDEELLSYWHSSAASTFVTSPGGELAGCYLLKAAQSGRGAHIANASYMVAAAYRGRGVGRALAEHSLEEARRRGFLAMQFNFVVSTNTGAIALWKSLGFEILGTVPRAFDHPKLGLVSAHIMHRAL